MPKLTREQIERALAFNSVKHNPPARVKAAERKHGKAVAQKMRVAIALDKARKASR